MPAIGCHCPVCRSADARNNRRRCSVLFRVEGVNLLIDTPPDYRDQALKYGIDRVDAALITHTHADHIFGMDDLRRYGFMQGEALPIYGSSETVEELRRFFYYTSDNPAEQRALPRLQFTTFPDNLQIGPLKVTPIDVPHGPGVCTGFVVQHNAFRLGYFPDCSELPENTIKVLQGLDVMILDALRIKPSPSHLTLDQSVAALQAIGAKQSSITHLSHDLDHAETEAGLPAGISVAYDGLEITW